MPPSQDIYKQLVDYDATRKNSVDVLNDALGKYGVPEIRNRVSGLRTTLSNTESALNAVDPSVTGRTQGSLVTEAQRTRQVANERAPTAEQYGQFSRSLGDANADLTDRERAAQLLAQGQLSDWDKGRQSIAERYSLSTAAEAEQRRREEADRAYQLQREQTRAASNNSAQQAALSSLLGKQSQTASTSQPAVSQPVYDSVRAMLDSNDQDRILREFNAIATSAGFGNATDKQKLQVLYQLNPGLFNGRSGALKLAGV